LTLVEVEVVAVVKGDRKVGKTRLGAIGQRMEIGKRYLIASFGGSSPRPLKSHLAWAASPNKRVHPPAAAQSDSLVNTPRSPRVGCN
jgi:hypothetical protein